MPLLKNVLKGVCYKYAQSVSYVLKRKIWTTVY